MTITNCRLPIGIYRVYVKRDAHPRRFPTQLPAHKGSLCLFLSSGITVCVDSRSTRREMVHWGRVGVYKSSIPTVGRAALPRAIKASPTPRAPPRRRDPVISSYVRCSTCQMRPTMYI